MKDETVILLLAAGASKRLGTPKQLLSYKEGTLLEDTISKLLTLQAQKVYVVLGAHFDRIQPTIAHLPIGIIQNHEWEKGMGTSISTGISYLIQEVSCKKILITLVDLPLFEISNYEALLNTHNTNNLGISVTKYTNNQGVPVVFDSAYFESLIKLSGEEGAKSILMENKSDVAYYEANIAYFDIDTMDDYVALVAP
ncbi:nucleotidyltransferase family protein [Flavobacteriaceae bacterium S356]|uniref:Nucleotidyltransferase family protein n=1 Tax=Asprobacillus argus TaxID=3076534 RepID=A0ABU3LCN1_9FLAO|nr:nucleotidyltransferase family protein [Flavobacteriaceae bacterium S356]